MILLERCSLGNNYSLTQFYRNKILYNKNNKQTFLTATFSALDLVMHNLTTYIKSSENLSSSNAVPMKADVIM
jgi:hypothetical protein